jgi:glucose/arabinose dehydrogenase
VTRSRWIVAAVLAALAIGVQPASARVPEGAGAPPPGSGTIDYPFYVRVIDGDTIELDNTGSKYGVRLIGYDAPPGNTKCGEQAAERLQALTADGIVLKEDTGLTFADGLRLYRGYTHSGKSIARALVRAGLARATGQGAERNALRKLQRLAKRAGRGCVWKPSARTVVPPDRRAESGRVPYGVTQIPGNLPFGFSQALVAGGFTNPTGFAFLPDGRILVAEKHGIVKLVKNGVVSTFLDISSRVNDYWDRGLVGIAVPPDFATSQQVYLYYVYENNSSDYTGRKTARIARYTVTGDTASAASEQVIVGGVAGAGCPTSPVDVDCIPADYYGHNGGTLTFAADGTLFASIGDASSWTVVDPNALRAQDIDSLAGKILHITKDGQGVASNPFYNGNPDAHRSKVWAYGFRNPFRFSLKPGTSVPYVGDVGWDTTEEIDVAKPGQNFGWPCYEGSAQQSGYAALDGCKTLYAQGAGAVTPPLVQWNHNGQGAAALGGTFLTGSAYPSEYQGAYFYGDYAQGFLKYLKVDGNDALASGPTAFGAGIGAPVDLQQGPDGKLYYLSISSGQLIRIISSGSTSNPPPSGTSYISDLPFTVTANGWGPVERDMSNGEQNAGDGHTITLNGVQYAKGLGAHAASDVSVPISGCTSFLATVGVDDEVGNSGSVTFQVWVDGVKKYESPVLTGASASASVNVDVTNASMLRLVVTNGGDNINYDHADWADARLACGTSAPPSASGDSYLSDLSWTSATNGWGPVERDMSNGEQNAGDGHTITLNGVTYQKGLGAHAQADITFALDGTCTAFKAVVGVDDEVGSKGSVDFQVFADSTKVFDSGVVTGASTAVPVDADITGATTLRLSVTNGGDNMDYDHADWADARITCGAGGTGGGTANLFASPVTLAAGTNAHGIASTDLDGDGNPDLVVANAGDSTLSVYLGNGAKGFTLAGTLATGSTPKQVAAGDLNGDGIPDLVTANQYAGTISVFIGRGGGSFAARADYTALAGAHEATIADLNRDGKQDVALAAWGGSTIGVFLGNGDGTLKPMTTYQSGAAPHSIVAADFNKDGNIDLAVANHDANTVGVLLGKGDGTFQPVTALPVGTRPHCVRTADLNGDGALDLVTANDGSSTVSVLLGHGDGTFFGQVQYATGPTPKSVAIADLDGDGSLDLATANVSTNYEQGPGHPGGDTVSVLLGNGSGSFASPQTYQVGMTPFAVVAVDLDKDGKVDLATANWHGNSASILFNTGSAPAELAVVTTDPAAGASAVSPGTKVKATFSKGVDASSVTASTFSVAPDGQPGSPVAASVTYDATTKTATLTPQSPLQGGVSYVATVKGGSSGVKDTSGSPLPSDYMWRFTVGSSSAQTTYLSDMTWTSAVNGWGPVERDMSNGEQNAGDGGPITLNGTTYAKGLGAHAQADITFPLDGTCTRFKAAVGVDDEVGSNGSVDFQVYSGTAKVFDSGVVTGASAPVNVDVDITDATSLRLVVTNGGDNIDYDHADWADARVECGGGTSSNAAPVPTITAPTSDFTYAVGDTITYAGSATDPEDGTLPASALTWQIVIHHCPGGTCHTHLFLNPTGSGGSFTAPDHGDDTYFVFTLTATDSQGKTASTSVTIMPKTVLLTLETQPSGLQVVYTGDTYTTPVTITTIVNSTRTIYAPSPQSGLNFVAWSDGGAQQHNVTLGSSAVTYTATFGSAAPTVQSITPADGSAGVSIGVSPSATFSGAMDASTITTSSFTLVPQGGSTPVAATVSYVGSTNTAVLTPSSALQPSQTYIATIKGGSNGVKSRDGTALAADKTWSFTTAAAATRYLSDLTWTYMSNGWGPVEKDMSVGGFAAGDGRTITLSSVKYTKGLGAHAASDVRYALSRSCTSFQASVGVDDEVGSRGSVVFQVWADGVKLYDSGRMTGSSATKTLNVSIANRTELKLVVTDAGDGINYDHADWASARITCAS